MTGSKEPYTGPTSGRITVRPDGEISKETFTDPPLTAEEGRAVAWFSVLPPHAQLREVRILKWNLEEAQRGRDEALLRARRAERLVEEMKLKLSEFTPDGYSVPGGASILIQLAESSGWQTARAWRDRSDSFGDHLFTVLINRTGPAGEPELSWEYKLSWSCTPTSGRFSSGTARTPDNPQWRDAPSLANIRRTIAENPVEGAP
jgi:hypothetical protein